MDSNPEQVSNRKLAIARRAAERIRDHNRVIIDSGSTTSAMIPMLGNKRGLIVMTNSSMGRCPARAGKRAYPADDWRDLGSPFRIFPGAGGGAGAALL